MDQRSELKKKCFSIEKRWSAETSIYEKSFWSFDIFLIKKAVDAAAKSPLKRMLSYKDRHLIGNKPIAY